MGAGGLGGYFGARLAAAGNDVAFVARGAHLAAIRQDGLRVESARGDLHLRDVAATDDPATLAPADVVIIAVKLWDTETAAEAVKPLVRPGTAVVSFQNGVSKDEVLTRILGREAVIGGVGQIGVVIASPGVIRHTGTMAKLTFGELDNTRTPRVEALLDACTAAGIDAEIAHGHQPGDLAEIRLPGADVGLHCQHALDHRPDPRQSADPWLPARHHARGRRGRPALGVRSGGRLRRAADGVRRDAAAADDRVDAGRPGSRQPPGTAMAEWRRGRAGRRVGVPTPLNRAVADILALYVNGAP